MKGCAGIYTGIGTGENWNIFSFNKYLALFMAFYVFILNCISVLFPFSNGKFGTNERTRKKQQSIRNQCFSVSVHVAIAAAATTAEWFFPFLIACLSLSKSKRKRENDPSSSLFHKFRSFRKLSSSFAEGI